MTTACNPQTAAACASHAIPASLLKRADDMTSLHAATDFVVSGMEKQGLLSSEKCSGCALLRSAIMAELRA